MTGRLNFDLTDLDGQRRRRAAIAVTIAARVLDDVGMHCRGHDRLAGIVGEQHGRKNYLLIHQARNLFCDLATALTEIQQLLGKRLDSVITTVNQPPRSRVLKQGRGAALDAAVTCHGMQ